jgi:signal transduction histidine kinase
MFEASIVGLVTAFVADSKQAIAVEEKQLDPKARQVADQKQKEKEERERARIARETKARLAAGRIGTI